jgi:glycosyltransferase involved in cell wall biosynthesis
MTPTVSVAIATYNYGRYLGRALDSALGQTFRDLEVVVLDDGSTDDTPAVVEPYLKDSRVRYHRAKHLGVAAAKSAAVDLCRAPFVAFLDADDEWMPDKLERQMALFFDPEVGVVSCGRELIDADGCPLEFRQPALHRGRVLPRMYETNFVCFSSAVVRRVVLDAIGLFDPRLPLAVDYDLWLRAATRCAFDFVPEPLVKYRVGHANLSRRAEERLRTVVDIRERFLNEYGGQRLLDPALVRDAYMVLCCDIALIAAERSRLAALPWLLRALAVRPLSRSVWHGLVRLPLPDGARRLVRRLLGRDEDWSVRRRAPQSDACVAGRGMA